jgi:DNA-binding XRE family transcriptional regulator
MLTEREIQCLYTSVGQQIKAIRTRKLMTGANLGKRLGIQASAIFNIESGRSHMLINRLYEIAEALECRVEEIWPPWRKQNVVGREVVEE